MIDIDVVILLTGLRGVLACMRLRVCVHATACMRSFYSPVYVCVCVCYVTVFVGRCHVTRTSLALGTKLCVFCLTSGDN